MRCDVTATPPPPPPLELLQVSNLRCRLVISGSLPAFGGQMTVNDGQPSAVGVPNVVGQHKNVETGAALFGTLKSRRTPSQTISPPPPPPLPTRHSDLATQGLAYARIGSTYEAIGEHAQALQFLHNALTIAESTGDAAAQATACSLLCQVSPSVRYVRLMVMGGCPTVPEAQC